MTGVQSPTIFFETHSALICFKKNWINFQADKQDINHSTAAPGAHDVAGRPSHYLEDGGVHFLVVILFASVFPRDPEHALLVVLPDQPWVHGTVDLLNQPLPQPPAAVAVTHPWKEKT